jgi:CRP-like cAMP-binding protein
MNVSRTVEYQDGEFIILEGGQSDRRVYVVLEGQAKVIKETEKGQVKLALLEEGDIFGEVAFLKPEDDRHSASVVTKGYVKVGIIDPDRLKAEYERLSPTFKQMLLGLAERFSKATALASQLAARRMDRPNLEQRQAKRSSPLRELRIQVSYRPQGVERYEGYQGLLLDLARTGMGLELFSSSFSKTSHPLGSKFVFEFSLPGKPVIRVPGHIVWLREMGEKKARMGVQLTEANPYIQRLISDFLQSLEEQ